MKSQWFLPAAWEDICHSNTEKSVRKTDAVSASRVLFTYTGRHRVRYTHFSAGDTQNIGLFRCVCHQFIR